MEFVPKISEPLKPGSALLVKKEPRIEVGSEIFRRFLLTAELGKGRCSTSWLVEDPRFRRDVVLKLFRSNNVVESEDERIIWRDFLRRLRILNHPDIVITMEFFHEGSWLALSSTYENGPTLAAVTLQSGKLFTLPETLAVLKTVGNAVAAARDKCLILHGNLNAFNILIPKRRRSAKITDFGFHPPLAGLPEDQLGPELAWKMACYSPERLAGAPPSHEDDIYAFGAISYQLFTGSNPPLDANGHLDRATAENRLSDAPPEWRSHLLAALAPRPEDRPEALTLLLQELKIYEEFDPRQLEIEKAQLTKAAVKKPPRTSKSPDNLRPKSTFLFRTALFLSIIGAPFVVGYIIYRSNTTKQTLQRERFEEEKKERANEAAEADQVIKLNSRLGGSDAPSRTNLALYSQTMNEPAPTPKPTPLVINSGALDFYREGQTKFAAGDAAGAMESYELAVVLQANWPDLLEARGLALLADERADAAVLEFSKCLIIEPQRVKSLIGRAKARIATGDKSAAKNDLQAVLSIEPNNLEARELVDKNKFSLGTESGLIH